LFSGGCVIWMLAAFYLVFDVLPFGKLSWPLQVIGMNSLAVYFMGELLHHWTSKNVVQIHMMGFLESLIPGEYLEHDMFGGVIEHCAVAIFFWLACVWMYRNKLFVRV